MSWRCLPKNVAKGFEFLFFLKSTFLHFRFYHLSSLDELWKFIRRHLFGSSIKGHYSRAEWQTRVGSVSCSQTSRGNAYASLWMDNMNQCRTLFVYLWTSWFITLHTQPVWLGQKNWRNLMIIYVLFSKRWRKNMVFYFWKMWAIFSRTTHILSSGGVGQVCLLKKAKNA